MLQPKIEISNDKDTTRRTFIVKKYLLKEIDLLSLRTDKSKSFIVNQALEFYIKNVVIEENKG